MAFKRPFGEEEFDLPSKHPRQLDCSNEPTPFADIADSVPYDYVPHEPHLSVSDGDGGFNKSECTERVVSDIATDSVGADKEFNPNASGSASSLSWVTSSASEEDSKSESADQLSFCPFYFKPEHQTRGLVEHDDVYSFPFDFPPRKLVSIGSDHQADVPVWGLEGIKNNSDCLDVYDPDNAHLHTSGSNYKLDDDSGEEMIGTCVLPMPSSEALTSDGEKVGTARTDCCCLDMGSIRCVRQHITEAREKLRESLGLERFAVLGFHDMGEVVARKWNEEDERVFHEVVLSHPASLGKNFWDHLYMVFPSRTKMELVSYYFNAFVLRRRAEQNRLDPLNIDSDNDEWQGSDVGDEVGSSEEDEDSVIQSPADLDESAYVEHFNEVDEDGDDECYDNNDDGNVVDDGGFAEDERLENKQTRKLPGNCNSMPPYEHNFEEDNDFQDDSCTSYECQPSRVESCGPVVVAAGSQGRRGAESENHHRKQPLHSGFEGFNNAGSHEYGIEHCDGVIWDLGYVSGSKGDVDLVPTCHMIKEVFGEEAWNSKERDGRASAGFS